MNWKKVKLGEYIKISKGKKQEEVVFSKDSKRYIQIEDLSKSNNIKFTNDHGVEVNEDDVIIAWDGANAGKVGTDLKGVIGSTLARLKILKRELNHKFFYRYLDSRFELIKSQRTGATIPHVSGDALKNLEIPLPDLTTQQHIAKVLDQADALRQQNRQLLAHYDELLQSTFIDLFGDPIKNEKRWEVKPVIECCETCIVPGRDKPKSFTGNVPWITTDDLNHLWKTGKSKKELGLSQKELEEVRARKIPKSSVIMTCVGDLGVISIAEKELVMNQQLHAFVCGDKIVNLFLAYALSYCKDYMYKMASSTTVAYMNKTVCNSIPIIFPPLSLQQQFAQIVEQIEEHKAVVKQSLAESEVLFEGLLAEYFG